MKRIRIGNDFVYLWSIERGGEPENLDVALEKKLLIKVFRKSKEIPFTTTGNVIKVELTPDICSIVGTYNLEFSYKLPDMSLSDDERTCTVDIDAFQIVGRTAQADEVEEVASTSDVALGLSGKDAFEVWLEDNPGGTKEDYYNWLQKPAIDIAETVGLQEQARVEAENTRKNNEEQRVEAEDIRLSSEQSRVEAEALRVTAETSRASNENQRTTKETARETAEGVRVQAENERETAESIRVSNENNRVTAEQERVNAESLRATAESSRELAESLRVEAESLRQTNTQEAISNAENATENANTAAQNADDAREAIEGDLALKANHGYGEEEPKTLKEVDDDLAQFESDVEQLAYVKIKNEAVNGDFENGLIAPFRKDDGGGGKSTLAINSSTPISGNYDIRFTIITPATTGGRPIFHGFHRAGNIGDKIYLHFYAKILSGTPRIFSINDGATSSLIYSGNIINGRNTRIIDVAGTASESGLIYFDSRLAWDMQMDNFMRINLTETFGAGNEPTEGEMNLLISTLGIDYFEGEITIPAQKVMQWQLALIRKNKNAIIALGGTII